ncbi:MAG: hypothetical protein WCA37_01290 [Terracidiphilus sp.]
MKPEPIDEIERVLRRELKRRPAPPGFQQRLLRRRQGALRTRHIMLWQRLAASVLVAAGVGGLLTWRHAQQLRKGEEASRQLVLALRITNHALNDVQARLAAHSSIDSSQGDQP